MESIKYIEEEFEFFSGKLEYGRQYKLLQTNSRIKQLEKCH